MNFVQKNPLPLPQRGEFASVKATMETVFDWQYAMRKENLLNLYEKGKALSWNASDLAWDTDVDLDRMMRDRIDSGFTAMTNQLLQPPKPFTDETAMLFMRHQNAFMLSQFLHGEQGALLATAKIVQTVPSAEAKFYAANQVADEARHVEVYHRYLTEKFGLSYEILPSLETLLDDIILDPRWDITFLGMQILVEGVALAAFSLVRMQLPDEPLIQDLITRVMQDESRHVAFGVISLEEIYRDQLTSAEMKEREDFVIEGAHLLRERFLLTPIFERLDWDTKLWTDWAINTPFQKGFRQMTFAKIVPNLKRLGLLTPRVRSAFEKMDLLRFEHLKDSVEEPEAPPPAELVEMLNRYLQAELAGADKPTAVQGTS